MEIDIEGIIKRKSPKLYRWLPRPVAGYLRRIVHQDEVNYCLRNFGHLPAIGFVRATLDHMEITRTAVGMERLDPKGRYILASNHPFGGMDGMMLADLASLYFGDVRVVVNDLLMNLGPMAPLFIPVNKHGGQNTGYARLYNDAFDSDMPIITFPAGLCSRRSKGVVCDGEWRHSFIKKAVASQRDVVPVFFKGELSDFFYRLSNIRRRLGLKANIEMLYLADEMFKQRGRHFDIAIGDPVPWQSLGAGRAARETAGEIKQKAYALGK